tara:strand:- start:595 stop:996 length:402 start_codon:yes stop_codon:yes gene_type:complete
MINILLLEDDDGDIFLIKKALSDALFENEVHVVHDGEKALELLKKEDKPRFDFIISDLNMPKMGGHEFLRVVQDDPELSKIPIAILTNSQEREDYAGSFKLDAITCLSKPLDQHKINTILTSIVNFWKKSMDI